MAPCAESNQTDLGNLADWNLGPRMSVMTQSASNMTIAGVETTAGRLFASGWSLCGKNVSGWWWMLHAEAAKMLGEPDPVIDQDLASRRGQGFDPANDSHAVQAIGGSYRLRLPGDGWVGLRPISISPVFASNCRRAWSIEISRSGE